MDDDRTLEKAAKAAGIDAEFHPELGYGPEGMWLKGERSPDNRKYWNPLTDDGDALRLAVKLGMVVDVRYSKVRGMGGYNRVDYWPQGLEHETAKYFACHDHDGDPYAATRRAIVRAAAALADTEPQ